MNKAASLVAQTVKNLPAMQETWIQSLGQDDTLEKGMATQSSILVWRTHAQRSLAGYRPWCRKESVTTEQLTLSFLGLYATDNVYMSSSKNMYGYIHRSLILDSKKKKTTLENNLRENESVSCSVVTDSLRHQGL